MTDRERGIIPLVAMRRAQYKLRTAYGLQVTEHLESGGRANVLSVWRQGKRCHIRERESANVLSYMTDKERGIIPLLSLALAK